MNSVKSISTIINRKSGWIKNIFLKKQLVHASLRHFKEIKSPAAVTGEVIKLKKRKGTFLFAFIAKKLPFLEVSKKCG